MAKVRKTSKTSKTSKPTKTSKVSRKKKTGLIGVAQGVVDPRILKNSVILQPLTSVKEDDLFVFLTASKDHKTMLITQWQEEKKVTRTETAALRNTIDLLRVSGSNGEMVAALTKAGVSKTSDLVNFDQKSLAEVITKERVNLDSKDVNAYATEVLSIAEAENPSLFFMHRVAEKPEWLDLDPTLRPDASTLFKDFYAKNKDFDLKNEPIISLETGKLNPMIQGIPKPTPELVKELTIAQQSLQLSSDTNMAALLFKNEVNIHKAVTSTHQSLIRELGIDAADATEIKQKAQQYHDAALNGFFTYRDLISNGFLSNPIKTLDPVKKKVLETLGNDTDWTAVKELNGLKDINSIEDLFGSLNYCDCESCKSVLSPAAYFVDLMRFTEKRVLMRKKGEAEVKILEETNPIHLKERRPDLWNLALTCDNTNKNIPYVEIINEVLTAFVEKHAGAGKPVPERLVEQQPDLEFLLPYNQYLDEVRTWLSYFKLTRQDILEYLYPTPAANEKQILAIERLNLSKEQYEIVINQNLQAKVDVDVLAFRKKSGLNAEDTDALVQMKFWEGLLTIVQKKNPADIQKFTLEFTSTIPNWQGKLHRLIRLWKGSGWSLRDLDAILHACNIKHNTLNADAILNLASFRNMQSLLAVEVSVVVGIINGFENANTDKLILSWKELLPAEWVENQEMLLDQLLATEDDDSFNLLLRLQGAFGVSSADMLACISLLKDTIGTQASPTDPVKIVFNTNALNKIYRYVQLYKWSEASSFQAFAGLLKIWGGGTTKFLNNPSDDIPSFVKFLNGFQQNNMSIDDLLYIFDKEEVDSIALINEDKAALSSGELHGLVASDAYKNGDKFTLLFNKWTSIDSGVLSYYKLFIELPDASLAALLSDLEVATTSDSTYIKLSNIRKRLERLDFLMTKYKIDVDTLKLLAEASKDCLYPRIDFVTWQDKQWVNSLACLSGWIQETITLRNFNLLDVLKDIEKEDLLPSVTQKAIAKWKQLDTVDVPGIVVKTSSIKIIKSIWDRIDWANKLNVTSDVLDRLKTDNSLASLKMQSQMLLNAIRSKFDDNETWETEIQDFKNKISSNRRDALCNYVIFNANIRAKGFRFDDREDLYRYFLLDVSMGDCFTLPRIVVATNSLQVYIHRCMMGFEQSKDESVSVLLDMDEKDEWEWRKNYRVWEANRKIFLFPENYIEPEIRDNKTPEFKELEDELLQQKLNMEVVENAYKKYIQQIMTLAELKIAGAYHDKESNSIFLFGKTNRQPVEWYYRNVEFLEGGGVLWSNWEKMNVSIPTEDVAAIRYNGKLYIFWTTFQRKDISDVTGGTQLIKMHTYDVYTNYSYLQVDKKWSPPQRIELDYRKSSPFDPFLRLERFKNQVEPNNTLKPEALEIRENVLKEFERTVYRKPYPSKSSDRNLLHLDYIWTDKKNALLPVYKYTRAIIDAFSVKVKLKVKLFTVDMEAEIEFSFNRFDEVVVVAATSNQSAPPATINISVRTRTWYFGDEKIEFIYSFSQNGTRYSVKTGTAAGNKIIFFKEPDKEIKSGYVDLHHQVDYVPVNLLEYERNVIKIADQKKVSSLLPSSGNLDSLRQEYNTYFDGFNDFFVTDGTPDYADGVNDYKIQQRDMVAILTTPSTSDINQGYDLNPEHIQMLWDKVSLSIDDLLDHNTQRNVADQIDYSKSFGNYFYELFFHIPMRIADHLNAAGKFREANLWYSYIYNPTALKENFEQLVFPYDVNWRFAAFRNMTIKKLQEIYSDPNAIQVYQRNPGNPHAIARLRVGAYQKNVVMKYLDNLMDWADYLYEQYTPESTSEARHLYNIVKSILGDKPEKTGKCKDAKTFTYADIPKSGNSDFIYNLFTITKKVGAANSKRVEAQRMRSDSSDRRLRRNLGTSAKSQVSSDAVGATMKKMTAVDKNMKEIFSNTGKTIDGSLQPDKKQGRPIKPGVYFDIDVDLAFCFPHNADFVAYWDRVNSRIYNLNNCMDINGVKKQMPAYAPEIDPALLARMIAGGMSFDDILGAINSQLPNYRFVYLIEKARQFCNTVQNFGASLFSAIEKRDSEELTLLKARHEQNILSLTTKNKKRQIDVTKTKLASALETKTKLEQRQAHFEHLIEEGLNEPERVEQIAKWTSGSIRTAEGILQLLSGAFRLIPQLGSPFAMKYGGLELGDSVSRFANALSATAKISDNVAILAGLEGVHERREQEWKFQLETTIQELKGLGEEIRGSEISVALAEADLELHNSNIEHSKELYEFYTSRFSNHQHYTFQVQQLQKLYRMAYNLAADYALQAQQAFEFERFGTPYTSNFIQTDNWNSERSGLLAGERLMLQLLQMEKEYMDTEKRTIEVTQHFSMMQIAPDKLYELKATGECVGFSIPEAAFDLTYPGYFRRIMKSVRITIPCIAGPYTNIGATLALGNNKIRKDKSSALSDFNFRGCTMIATSGAQNDGGQFELNFRDERYLPFEGAGAVSSWTLSLPKVKHAFDYSTISDVLFHISYTADYDGTFKATVEAGLIAELNKIQGTGLLRAFSLRHDFPNEWNTLCQSNNNTDIVLSLRKEFFPYFSNINEIASIEPKCYTVSSSNILQLMANNEGISKVSQMQIKVPKEAGKKSYKDIIFLVKYVVR